MVDRNWKDAAFSEVTSPNDNDTMPMERSATQGWWKASTLRTFFKTTYDSLYAAASHNHAGTEITSGTIADARLSLATPPAIGGTTPAAGTFTTLTTTGNIELGNNSDTTISRSAAGKVTIEGAAIKLSGKETQWVPAAAMKPATTSGASTGTYESTTNKVNIEVLDFDGAADEYAWFSIAMPKSWDEGTVTFQAFWFSTATDTDSVIWGLAGVAVSDNETLDVALGTAVTVTDNVQSAASELYVSAESSAITIAGTPAEGDLVLFRVFRDADTDTATEDARLVGIKLFFTTNAGNDA